jgi:hypothetical protein
MDYSKRVSISRDYSDAFEYNKWTNEIPEINFPSDWKVRITPPGHGAVIRFRVFKDKAEVSVYLDCYSILGCVRSPYWEIYPIDGDCERFMMNDINGLLDGIKRSIEEQNA